MKKILGVDLGTKRVGLAISDALGLIASPLGIVEVRSEWEAIFEVEKAYEENSAEMIVVGLARNMNGKLGEKGKECEAFAKKLSEKGYEVELWDERLSSAEAERSLKKANINRKKRKEKVDAVAAQIILNNFLAAKSNNFNKL